METTLEPDWRTLGVLGAARAARGGGDGRLGTEHLLAAVAGTKGPAGEALAAAGATATALLAALRDRQGGIGAARWSSDDEAGASVPARDALGPTGDRGLLLSGAAARALTGAMDRARQGGERKFTAEHLLRALLADRHARAVELLYAAGAAPRAVRDRLDADDPEAPGTAPDGPDAPVDGLDPLLRPTRDALLGRRPYPLPRWKRLLGRGSAKANIATTPMAWVRLETDEQAQRLGRRAPGTEHVLLAVLAVHEVACRHPQLAGEGGADPAERHAGGVLLARLGLDYARAHAALTAGQVRLPADPRAVDAYLDGAPAGQGTGPLVRTLLGEDTRARRLADTLCTDPDGLQRALAAALPDRPSGTP
ncbi:Clp protease N-terminal domain-containing protein [Kitasatospora sp. NPDC087314]|uniref:Clp protease N-terminal domain-containing protein n=1 Tax=Kitasatospora sp. NPDC087314 TaxID=3364068 RepID=UPI003816B5ED